MESTFIYTLSDSTGVRYIGKADRPVERLNNHLKECRKRRTRKEQWIDSLFKKQQLPVLEILEEVPVDAWQFFESYWIAQFKAWGFKLLNGTNGGEGSNGFAGKNHSLETRKRISDARSGKPTAKLAGETNGRAKLNWDSVASIRAEFTNGVSMKALSRKFGVAPIQISKIVKNLSWVR